jgi:dTDP-D-glucose 4,6-dehydratase
VDVLQSKFVRRGRLRRKENSHRSSALHPFAQTIQWYLDNKEWWEHIISGEYQVYFEKQYINK